MIPMLALAFAACSSEDDLQSVGQGQVAFKAENPEAFRRFTKI